MISIREVKITHTFQKVEHSRLGIKIAKVICCMYVEIVDVIMVFVKANDRTIFFYIQFHEKNQ